jgi:ubiquitin carboxyl-terminal hydrolase 34
MKRSTPWVHIMHILGNSYYSVSYDNILLIIKDLVVFALDRGEKLKCQEKQLLYSFKLYDKVMRSLTSTTAIQVLCELCTRLAHEDMYYSEIICGCVLRGIYRADQDEMVIYLVLL